MSIMTEIINELIQFNYIPGILYCILQVHGDYIVINSNKYLGTYWYTDVLE